MIKLKAWVPTGIFLERDIYDVTTGEIILKINSRGYVTHVAEGVQIKGSYHNMYLIREESHYDSDN